MPNVFQGWRPLLEGGARLPLAGFILERAYRRYFLRASGTKRLFCGIFPDFDAALRAIPKSRLCGYDNEASADRMMGEWLGVYPNDYPVLFWLERLLPVTQNVFDWGGNVGIKYFAFRRYLDYPVRLVWCVSDLPAIVERGRLVAGREKAPALQFTSTLEALAQADVLLASGVVQFVDDPFQRLRSVPHLPDHLIFNKVPVYDMPSQVTLHNMGTALCPYHLFNRAAFVQSIEALGYRLSDHWTSPDVACAIPFAPRHSIAAYSGFYFTRSSIASVSHAAPGVRLLQVATP
jgi:putative methyltransferase (TIGR04325 family)